MKQDIPNPKNFCGGNFQDWIEVNLTSACNGCCSWCVEKRGYHPKEKATWQEIRDAALETGKTNVILLGGEPTLYPHLKLLIDSLIAADRKVWITTNGSKLNYDFTCCNLIGIAGLNISIHHYDLDKNCQITGIDLLYENLKESIELLKCAGTSIRVNCNCIKGAIDSKKQILEYIEWAKELGVNKVRFAELKFDNTNFIDLAKIFNYKYGLNDNPFKDGCNSDAVIKGMPVNFRQMCGLQTSLRPVPVNPIQAKKQVLYYDGKIYDGWQLQKGVGKQMEQKKLIKLLKSVESGEKTVKEVAAIIQADLVVKLQHECEAGGCVY